MAKGMQRRSGLRNVSETWDQNERKRSSGDAPEPDEPTAVGEDLQQVIQEEAAEYDNANKEERVLGGDRATLSDNPGQNAPEE
jgi:hypothetical protein